ncbi:hypothetical protein [Robiginitalea aurantiaca]|uniref:Uncharacterized protein n=1 Tax=Robiginitalea aurantiaca TaxID=3056915 RepID=A0ABT7WGT3_9FLAO|nr:hypothetical protein [Robiginitalea aurantiaca]MDM9632128.1 hypothetical protein [Robiginitalea aurantiaca]
MDKNLKQIVWILMLLIFPVASYAQEDVTKFLDIPVDGYKPEMIEKLKSRGFTNNSEVRDILDGEFNGHDVNIFIITNNNKVWRIAVQDKYPTDETNIKIRFNKLIQQFLNNKRYSTPSDSLISKFIIPKDEDIQYEMSVNNKQYQASFLQKAIKSDSLTYEIDKLIAKEGNNEEDYEKANDLILERMQVELNTLNKNVWFMINEDYGEYRILMFYDNKLNKANGEGL